MLIKILTMTLLRMFCKIIPNSKVIFKSTLAADNKFLSMNGLEPFVFPGLVEYH